MAATSVSTWPLFCCIVILSLAIDVASGQSCPVAPPVLHSTLRAACSSEPARSAIGCSMYRFCYNDTPTPAIFPQLCTTFRIASSLCSDDAAVASIALCAQLRTAYGSGDQFRSCLQPYPLTSTAGIKALHLKACDDMEGYPGEPMGGCDTCTKQACPDPLASLSAGCITMPMDQCGGLDQLCAQGASVLCGRNLVAAPPRSPSPPPESAQSVLSPPGPGSVLSISTAAPSPPPPSPPPPSPPPACVANSSAPSCASYHYPLININADLDDLCTAMSYMPGCTIRTACQAGQVTGAYCQPMTLLATICVDMPGMRGCRSYVPLCKNTSVVQQCKQFPAIPGLPNTMAAKTAVVVKLCGALSLDVCNNCTMMSCPDYLTPLLALCTASPGADGCATYIDWCNAAAAWQTPATNSSLGPFCRKPPPPPAPSPPPPSPPPACVANSSAPSCASYQYPLININADLDDLCTAMSYMPGCTIRKACQAGQVTGAYCQPMTLLATICADMPGMHGCKSYVPLCKNTSVVQQCKQFPAIPGLPNTMAAKNAVVVKLCGALSLDVCNNCTMMSCPDYLTPLLALCTASPGADGCATYTDWCNAAAAWQTPATNSSLGPFCRKPPPPPAPSPPPPSPPPACVANSSAPSCASYQYPLINIDADLDDLCTAMSYMPGCTIRKACQAGQVTGAYCQPMTLLATICADMPSMRGCKSYVPLCKNTSVVQQCKQFPAIPGLPNTMAAKTAVVVKLCGALSLDVCNNCTMMSCPDYLTPLLALCTASPGADGCATYTDWCNAAAAWQTPATNSSLGPFCRKPPPPPPAPSPLLKSTPPKSSSPSPSAKSPPSKSTSPPPVTKSPAPKSSTSPPIKSPPLRTSSPPPVQPPPARSPQPKSTLPPPRSNPTSKKPLTKALHRRQR